MNKPVKSNKSRSKKSILKIHIPALVKKTKTCIMLIAETGGL